ncbi:MAG: class I SAM-dependent methyltransferase [Candidatus Aminicenantes bacterium]|nr:class I SAM-dependent methyltransferase [Candidatus Aminicenantes bacterium]
MNPALILAIAAVLALTAWHSVRVLSRRWRLPCPAALSWIVENPIARHLAKAVTPRLRLAPGMQVLDAGCGTGRLTLPIAMAIGPEGRVLAVDLQPEMLRRAKTRTVTAGAANIDFLQAGLGEGKIPAGRFDRALLSWVLGEIPDRLAALREIHASLKPGGFLLVSEVLVDPHYQSLAAVRTLAAQSGFRTGAQSGNFLAYSLALEKLG